MAISQTIALKITLAKTSIENLLSDHLQDLILPIENGISALTLLLLLGLLLFLLVVLATIIWRWEKHSKKPVKQAIRQLKQLTKIQNADVSASQKVTALQLSKILRDGLEVPRLDQYASKLESNDRAMETAKWTAFQSEIDRACYTKQTLNVDGDDLDEVDDNKADSKSLFNQAFDWLKKAEKA